MKEISILSEDEPPEGYIVNDVARKEMTRIAKAAHMQKDFAIYLPTFFGLESTVDMGIHEDSQAHFGSSQSLGLNHLFPVASVNASLSESQVSSGFGSFRSVDSNISKSSVHHTPAR